VNEVAQRAFPIAMRGAWAKAARGVRFQPTPDAISSEY
jgi:hypothetical protein